MKQSNTKQTKKSRTKKVNDKDSINLTKLNLPLKTKNFNYTSAYSDIKNNRLDQSYIDKIVKQYINEQDQEQCSNILGLLINLLYPILSTSAYARVKYNNSCYDEQLNNTILMLKDWIYKYSPQRGSFLKGLKFRLHMLKDYSNTQYHQIKGKYNYIHTGQSYDVKQSPYMINKCNDYKFSQKQSIIYKLLIRQYGQLKGNKIYLYFEMICQGQGRRPLKKKFTDEQMQQYKQILRQLYQHIQKQYYSTF